MSMPKLNAPAEIHWRRSNMNTRDPILMKSVEVLKDCRSLNAAAEMNCPMPRSVEKVPIRNEKRCTARSVAVIGSGSPGARKRTELLFFEDCDFVVIRRIMTSDRMLPICVTEA